jgi:nucleotide-binding universal stress UspA family protein
VPVALCVTEIVSYGVLFYAFTVLLPRIVDNTGWSATAVTAAFSAGSLTGGVAGIAAGRALQRHGPRWVMTGGSALGAVATLGVAWSPSYAVFFAAWVLAGVASAGLFYAPAFAALTAWYGDRRVQAITTLTLAGRLGRAGHGRDPGDAVEALGKDHEQRLLTTAAHRLGRPAVLEPRRGQPEREVLAACDQATVLVVARDGDHSHLGPHSIGPATRFVVDHAPCQVLLVWPDQPPDLATLPPAPPEPHRPPH